jgi:hypothetical protein
MSERPFNVIGLLCSSTIARALGATPVPAPDPSTGSASMLKHAGVRGGTAIAVATLSGEYFVWPVRGAA